MTDAERIVWLERYIKEIAQKISEIRELPLEEHRQRDNELGELLNDISHQSNVEHPFITGGGYWR